MIRHSLPVLVLFGLSACGDVVKSQTTDAGSSDAEIIDAAPPGPCERDEIELDDLPGCFVQGACRWITTCENGSLSMDDCVEAFGANVQGGLREIRNALEAGKATYDASTAAECIRSFETPICNGLDFGGNESCEQFFVGTVPDGEPCFASAECLSVGAYCDDGGDCSEQCCEGLCVAPAGVNEDCELVDCQDGLHCIEDAGTYTCRDGSEGQSCDVSGECDEELYCDLEKLECVPDHGVNVPCTEDGQCAWPLDCVGDGMGPGTCVYTDQLGSACDSSCDGPYFCRFDGGDVGTCDHLLENASPCSDDDQCQSRFCTQAGECRDRPQLNMNCEPNGCAIGLLCSSELPDGPAMGKCVERREIGQSCGSESHCETSVCGPAQTCVAVENCYAAQ